MKLKALAKSRTSVPSVPVLVDPGSQNRVPSFHAGRRKRWDKDICRPEGGRFAPLAPASRRIVPRGPGHDLSSLIPCTGKRPCRICGRSAPRAPASPASAQAGTCRPVPGAGSPGCAAAYQAPPGPKEPAGRSGGCSPAPSPCRCPRPRPPPRPARRRLR